MANLELLQEQIGHQFAHPTLLELALTHPSVTHESVAPNLLHNQRLEFLGDAVLGLVLTAELYARFPTMGEGPLTKARAQLVNRHSLAKQARVLHLGENLILSHGEETSGGRTRTSSLADAFEAVIGAVYVDAGYDIARAVVLRCFREEFGELSEIPNLINPKGELQELLQADSPEAPRYQLFAVTGPDHDRVFECAVFHGGIELGRGMGKSKKAAESEAALKALEHLRRR